MPKIFIDNAPSLTVSDVLLLFLCNNTVTVLLKLERFVINQLSSIHYLNVLPFSGLAFSNKFKIKPLLRPSTKVQKCTWFVL